jgi:hypothetical protein
MTILTVGAGQQFARLADAIAASRDGDVINVAAGTYTNDFAVINHKITIQGVGGMVRLVATGPIPNGKAILVTNTDVTLDHIEFSGAKVPDGNGAGIRYQAGNLVIRNCYFHDNQDGILTADSATGTIDISRSEFARNGTGDGYTHGLYVGDIASLHVTDSYFHDTLVGHHIKSRAQHTVIENSRLFDGTGTASYNIDLPNGGDAVIRGNTIVQGANTQNPSIIHFGGAATIYAGSHLQVDNNVIENFASISSATGVWNQTATTAALSGNKFYHVGKVGSGPYKEIGDVTLSSPVALDTSHPWSTSASPSPAPAPAPAPVPAPAPAPAPSPVPPPATAGQTQITIHASGDVYKGDPLFQLFVDGRQIGGTYDVSALHRAGQWQDITVTGDFGAAGPQKVVVKFFNDAYGGTSTTDRNLYIDSIDVNGHRFEGEAAVNTAASGRAAIDPHAGVMLANGTLTFATAGAPPVMTNAAGYAVITGGSGSDELVAGTVRAALTGGGGKDAFILTAGAHDHLVTDFRVGEDLLDLRTALKAAGYQGSDPVAAGVLSVTQSGADALFSLDPDGAAGAGAPHALVTLQHVTAGALKAGIDYFWH